MAALAEAGLEHVQLSLQDADPAQGDRIAGLAGRAGAKASGRSAGARGGPAADHQRRGASAKSRPARRNDRARARRLAPTGSKSPMSNITVGPCATAPRCCRPASSSTGRPPIVEAARARLKGVLTIDYVVPDYYARRPKACMGGWGRRFLNVTPAGKVLPCHAAETLPGCVSRMSPRRASPRSGSRTRLSTAFAAQHGCPSPAGAASAARSIGAAAAARPLP